MDICTKIHGKQLYYWQDMSLKSKNVNLMVALEEKVEGSPKLLGLILRKPHIVISVWTKVMDQLTDQQTLLPLELHHRHG